MAVTTPPVKVNPPAVDKTDYAKVFNDKCNAYIQEWAGKPGHNPFIALGLFEDILQTMFLKKDFTPEQKQRITAAWPAPKV